MARPKKLSETQAMTAETLETLLDLLEIKLACFEVYDREDNRELKRLNQSREEIYALLGRAMPEMIPPALAVAQEAAQEAANH